MSDEQKKPKFELRDDGEVHLNSKGNSQLLAKYDPQTGILVFESFEIDQKYRTEITGAIIENPHTGELSGNRIRAYAIYGRPVDRARAGEPPPPKRDKMLGDKTPAYVRWLYKWRPQRFYARYGVFLDSNGEPTRAPCIRIEQGFLIAAGAKPTEIGDRAMGAMGHQITETEDGMLAVRATVLTFTKGEVITEDGTAAGDDEQDDGEPLPEDSIPEDEEREEPPKQPAAEPDDEDGPSAPVLKNKHVTGSAGAPKKPATAVAKPNKSRPKPKVAAAPAPVEEGDEE